MMDYYTKSEQVKALLRNEVACVKRQDGEDRCNRDCGNCDLVQDTAEIIEMYEYAEKAISMLQRIRAVMFSRASEETKAMIVKDIFTGEADE